MNLWKCLVTAICSLGLLGQSPAESLEILRHSGVYSPGFGMEVRPEYSLEVSGEYSLLDGERLAILDPSGRVKEVLNAPPLPSEASSLKYSAGRFWARTGASAISEYLSRERTWVPRLLTKTTFKDFEVTFDGRVLLIATPSHLVEFYQPMSSQAEWALDYPSMEGLPDGRDASKDPYFFWSLPVCARVEEDLLIYFPNLGRLYRTNILSRSLNEMDVPWERLSINASAKLAVEQGFIPVTSRPPCNGIEFIPETSSRVRVIYSVNNAEFKLMPPAEGEARPKIVESKASSEHGIHWFAIELDTGRASSVRDEPERKLPVGLNPKGDLISMEEIFNQEQPRPPGLPSNFQVPKDAIPSGRH